MANLRIKDLTSEATVQSTDMVELDRATYADTHKVTVDELTSLEADARVAQDNVIEAGAGLDADGTYTATANTWALRAADFAAGVTDRGGATGALTASLKNADRMLDALIYALGNRITTVENTYFTKTVTLDHGDILSAYSAPILAIDHSAEIGKAGFAIRVYAAEIYYDFSAAAYGTNTELQITALTGSNPQLINDTALADATKAGVVFWIDPAAVTKNVVPDDDIMITVATGNPTLGNVANTAKIYLHCMIINTN